MMSRTYRGSARLALAKADRERRELRTNRRAEPVVTWTRQADMLTAMDVFYAAETALRNGARLSAVPTGVKVRYRRHRVAVE